MEVEENTTPAFYEVWAVNKLEQALELVREVRLATLHEPSLGKTMEDLLTVEAMLKETLTTLG
jgi:hypothetical protein